VKQSVLVVEDNPYVAKMTAASLEALGYSTECAGTATRALKVSALRAFDGVVIDFDLRGRINGAELLAALLVGRPELPAIIVTGLDEAHIAAPPLVPVLRKPYRAAELASALFGANPSTSGMARAEPPPP